MREAPRSTSGVNAIQVENLYVSFGDFVAIPGLTFEAHYGEIHGVIGPNGAGKTTLLDVITGNTRPKRGTVMLDGCIDLLSLDETQIALKGVGRKFQKPSVFEALTVCQNLEISIRLRPKSIAAELSSWDDFERANRVEKVLDEIGLTTEKHTLAATLPHGKKQWLEIGMLLMQQPKLLMLDEPVAGMTEEETSKTAALIRNLRSFERSIMVIEHNMTFVETIADRVTVLHEGLPIFEGQMAHARANAQVRQVYLGR